MSAAGYLDILACCENASGTKHFMLQSGLDIPLEDVGVAGQVGLCAETLGNALSFVDACLGYLTSGGGLDVSTARGRCQVRVRQGLASDHDARRHIQYVLGAIVKFICGTKHTHDPNLRIHYPGAQSNLCLSRYGAPLFIDSTEAMVEFDARSLNRPMLSGYKDEAAILSLYMDANRIDDVHELSLSEKCERLIESSFEIGQPSGDSIASMLGLHVRALQRQLKSEGTTYREILAKARQRLALKEMAEGASILELALKLGYEYPQNFTTAFEKWFGSTPSAVRSQELLSR